jgi:23S rRNA (uracil1939-C5)-methyltransferase
VTEQQGVTPATGPAPAGESFTATVRIERLVAGGEALAHDDDGRVVLVSGALPGELVDVHITRRSERLVRATATAVLEASSNRVVPSCRHVAEGCGGCDLQHAAADAQPSMKVGMVADALRHLGGMPEATVEAGPVLAPWGFRTTVRGVVDGQGRIGLRRAQSHEPVRVERCPVAHPLVDEVLAEGRFPGASEVVVRAGAGSGDRLVVVTPAPRRRAGRVMSAVRVPDGTQVVSQRDSSSTAAVREQVGGRWWRISAGSFFQSRPDGAQALVDTVTDAVDGLVDAGAERSGALVDAYGGVGLFAGALRSAGWSGPMATIERSPASVADARHNLADDGIDVMCSSVETWHTDGWQDPVEVVVADPSRRGLGRDGVTALADTGSGGLVLVSCDAAALGRDAALLADEGFALERSVVVDLFPHTHHVEVVSTFVR